MQTNLVGDPRAGDRTTERFFDPEAFEVPSPRYGNIGRNALSSDPMSNTDFSLSKIVQLEDRRRLEIRVEAFKVVNHIAWAVPGTLLGRAGAGRMTSSRTPPESYESA